MGTPLSRPDVLATLPARRVYYINLRTKDEEIALFVLTSTSTLYLMSPGLLVRVRIAAASPAADVRVTCAGAILYCGFVACVLVPLVMG